jgi:hypothetical protein
MSDEEIRHCSFCERSNDRQGGVRIVIQGSNGAALCSGCADLVVEEMAERRFEGVVEIMAQRKSLAAIEVTVYSLDEGDYEHAYWGGRSSTTEPVKNAVRRALGDLSRTFDVPVLDPSEGVSEK